MATPSYNTKKLNDALLGVTLKGGPLNLETFKIPQADTTVAQYLNTKLFGYDGGPATDAATALERDEVSELDKERERSALTRVFDWMSGPMYAVQNTIADVAEGIKGEDSFGQTLQDIGNNLGSAAASLTKPVAEVAMLPGLELPFIEDAYDKSVGKYIDNENIQHHGDGRMHGSRLLEDLGMDTTDQSTSSKIGRAVSGFGVDVLTDPLTYLTLGAVPAIKGVKKGVEAITEGVDAASTLNKAAAGIPMPGPAGPSVFTKPAQSISQPSVIEGIRDIKAPRTDVPNFNTRPATPAPNHTQTAAEFDKWAQQELAALRATKYEGRIPAEIGKRMSRLQKARTYLEDSASAGYYNKQNWLDQPLRDLLPEHTDLADEFLNTRIGDKNADLGLNSVTGAGRSDGGIHREGADLDWGLTPVQQEVLRANVGGLTPEAARTAKMTQLSHKRWYEDLHDVPVTGDPVKNLKPNVSSAGKNSVDDVPLGDPRELTRTEFRQIFEESQAAYLAQGGKLSSADPKYFARGVEDALEAKGFKLPENSEISRFLKSGGHLDDYVKGKPLKELPDFYPNAAQAKKVAASASKKDIDNVHLGVSNIIEDIAKGQLPAKADKFLPATGAAKAKAEELADEAWDAVLAAGGKRGNTLNAPNQANMFERMQRHARKTLGKGANKTDVRNRAVELMRAAEDHMIRKGITPVAWGNSSLRLTDVLAEVSTEALDSFIPQVMKAFAKNDSTLITNPEVRTIVERALAGRHLEVSAIANAQLDKFNTEIKGLWDNFTPAAAERRAGLAKARLDDELRALGLSPDEAGVIKELARTKYVDPEEFRNMPFEDYRKAVHNAIKTDKELSPRLATALTKVIDDVLEEAGEVYNVYKHVGTGKNVNKKGVQRVVSSMTNMDNVDSMLTRITTWYGRGPEWHTYKNGLGYAEKVAMTKAKWFRDINSKFSREEQIAAWGIMTGRLGEQGLVDGRLAIEGLQDSNQRELALKLFDYLDWTIGHKSAWATKSDNALDGVTAMKSALTMADVDAQLKAIGSPINFAKLNKGKKGADNEWVTAIMDVEPWQTWRKTPASMLLDLDRAMTRTHMNYAMIDDFVGRMGRRVDDAGFNGYTHTAKINHARIPEDMRFEPKVAAEFNRLLSELDKAPWAPGNKASKAYFTALRHWKSGVTIYSPSHHVRNAVGDSWLMWMDGVNNPRVFRDAQKLMWAHRQNYKGALKVDEAGNPPELDVVMGLISRNEYSAMNSHSLTNIISRRGVDLNADDIYRAADERGLFATADQLEDIIGGSIFKEGEFGKKGLPKPFGGKVHNSVAKVTEYREHYFRSAHFIDVVRKGITPQVASAWKAASTPEAKRKVLDPIFNEAARRVRKWHPDGRDLTDFEQRWGRGLIPFYSWQRKSIPLFIQAMVENPGNIAKMTSIPKANFALQQAMGIEAPSYADPFPTDELFPDWIRAGGMGPIGDVEAGGLSGIIGALGRQGVDNSGEQYGMTVINPGNPFQDFIKDFGGMPSTDQNPGGFLKTLMDQSTPIFQWASAIQSGEKTTGAPIKTEEGGDGWGEYALSQVPIASHLQRWTGAGKEENPQVENGPVNTQALLNYLTGAGILGTGMYNKSAEFNQRDYLRRIQGQ